VLDRVARSAETLSEAERRQLYRRLWPMYAAAGRFQQAEQAIDATRPADRSDFVNQLTADMARAELLDAYLVPFVEDEHTVFLKTIIPSRKATKEYLGEESGHEDHED
jgi:hypothetical protein